MRYRLLLESEIWLVADLCWWLLRAVDLVLWQFFLVMGPFVLLYYGLDGVDWERDLISFWFLVVAYWGWRGFCNRLHLTEGGLCCLVSVARALVEGEIRSGSVLDSWGPRAATGFLWQLWLLLGGWRLLNMFDRLLFRKGDLRIWLCGFFAEWEVVCRYLGHHRAMCADRLWSEDFGWRARSDEFLFCLVVLLAGWISFSLCMYFTNGGLGWFAIVVRALVVNTI